MLSVSNYFWPLLVNMWGNNIGRIGAITATTTSIGVAYWINKVLLVLAGLIWVNIGLLFWAFITFVDDAFDLLFGLISIGLLLYLIKFVVYCVSLVVYWAFSCTLYEALCIIGNIVRNWFFFGSIMEVYCVMWVGPWFYYISVYLLNYLMLIPLTENLTIVFTVGVAILFGLGAVLMQLYREMGSLNDNWCWRLNAQSFVGSQITVFVLVLLLSLFNIGVDFAVTAVLEHSSSVMYVLTGKSSDGSTPNETPGSNGSNSNSNNDSTTAASNDNESVNEAFKPVISQSDCTFILHQKLETGEDTAAIKYAMDHIDELREEWSSQNKSPAEAAILRIIVVKLLKHNEL